MNFSKKLRTKLKLHYAEKVKFLNISTSFNCKKIFEIAIITLIRTESLMESEKTRKKYGE